MRINEIEKSKGDLAEEMADMLYMLRKAQIKGDLERVDQLKKNIRKIKDKLFQTEAKKMKGKDPCWSGYEMIGTKKKGNKDVPNCVPKAGKKKS